MRRTDLLEEKHWEVEYEVEELSKQKIEVEIEYLAIIKVVQNLKVGTGSPQAGRCGD